MTFPYAIYDLPPPIDRDGIAHWGDVWLNHGAFGPVCCGDANHNYPLGYKESIEWVRKRIKRV